MILTARQPRGVDQAGRGQKQAQILSAEAPAGRDPGREPTAVPHPARQGERAAQYLQAQGRPRPSRRFRRDQGGRPLLSCCLPVLQTCR